MKLPKHLSWYATIGLVVVVLGVYYLRMYSSTTVPENDAVKKVTSEQEFESILNNAGSRMIVVDLYADWCGPCKIVYPTLTKLAEKYSGKVDFYRINIDEHPRLASAFGTQAIPYVVFIKGGKRITAFTGVNGPETYERIIVACAESDEPCDQVLQMQTN